MATRLRIGEACSAIISFHQINEMHLAHETIQPGKLRAGRLTGYRHFPALATLKSR
jgi:hypothetical protein